MLYIIASLPLPPSLCCFLVFSAYLHPPQPPSSPPPTCRSCHYHHHYYQHSVLILLLGLHKLLILVWVFLDRNFLSQISLKIKQNIVEQKQGVTKTPPWVCIPESRTNVRYHCLGNQIGRQLFENANVLFYKLNELKLITLEVCKLEPE